MQAAQPAAEKTGFAAIYVFFPDVQWIETTILKSHVKATMEEWNSPEEVRRMRDPGTVTNVVA